MKAKLETGLAVSGKFGEGMISKIITKSTGYVEVTWNSGKVSKEMAFNLKVNGEELKSKPVHKVVEYDGTNNFQSRLKSAYEAETGRTGLSLDELKRI